MLFALPRPGENVEIDCSSPERFGFFDLVDAWDWSVQRRGPLHRICTLARRAHVSHLWIEGLVVEHDADLTTELAAVHKRAAPQAVTEGLAHRLAFLRRSVGSHEAGLAYADILSIKLADGRRFDYIFRARVAPPTLIGPWTPPSHEPDNGRPVQPGKCVATDAVALGDRQLVVAGVFFAQQNDFTSVCAHSALRSIFNTWQWLRPSPTNLTSEDINAHLGYDHINKRFGREGDACTRRGLDVGELMRFAKSRQVDAHPAEYEKIRGNAAAVAFPTFAIPYLDSGFPLLVAMGTRDTDHAIAVHGHTVNALRWSPVAQRAYASSAEGSAEDGRNIYSSSWSDHLIVADDNIGVHGAAPVDLLRAAKPEAALDPDKRPDAPHHRVGSEFVVKRVVAFVPRKTHPTAPHALELGAAALRRAIEDTRAPATAPREAHAWDRRLVKHLEADRIVFRCLAMSRENLRSALANLPGVSQNIVARIAPALEHQNWVVECTLPDVLTGNRGKLGEAFVAASSGPAGALVVAWWLPSRLAVRRVDGVFVSYAWPVYSHVPMVPSVGTD